MAKRIFWIIADSFGIGNAPDAALFSDDGANTLRSCMQSGKLHLPTMASLGLFHIDGVNDVHTTACPIGCYGRLLEASAGKDTTIGHWELCNVFSHAPLPTYPNGFPEDVLKALKEASGRDILCNKPYSGTEVIRDYGEEHTKTGALIVYTSADSVLQIAAHEEIVPVETLYEYCRRARDIMRGEHGVGRIIARPFIGDSVNGFVRTERRHDFSLEPPEETLLDRIKSHGLETIGVGKIYDIFAGQGLTRHIRTKNNEDGLRITAELMNEEFTGLCFVNLVDFDMIYGHRRDVIGYTEALNRFDTALSAMIANLRAEDVLIISADHGCDPAYKGTDHTREAVPVLLYGHTLQHGVNLGTRTGFADVGATIASLLMIPAMPYGTSFAKEILA